MHQPAESQYFRFDTTFSSETFMYYSAHVTQHWCYVLVAWWVLSTSLLCIRYYAACWIWQWLHFMVYPNKFLAYNVTNTHPPAPIHTHTHTSIHKHTHTHTRTFIIWTDFTTKRRIQYLPRICARMRKYHMCVGRCIAAVISYTLYGYGRPHVGYLVFFSWQHRYPIYFRMNTHKRFFYVWRNIWTDFA